MMSQAGTGFCDVLAIVPAHCMRATKVHPHDTKRKAGATRRDMTRGDATRRDTNSRDSKGHDVPPSTGFYDVLAMVTAQGMRRNHLNDEPLSCFSPMSTID